MSSKQAALTDWCESSRATGSRLRPARCLTVRRDHPEAHTARTDVCKDEQNIPDCPRNLFMIRRLSRTPCSACRAWRHWATASGVMRGSRSSSWAPAIPSQDRVVHGSASQDHALNPAGSASLNVLSALVSSSHHKQPLCFVSDNHRLKARHLRNSPGLPALMQVM